MRFPWLVLCTSLTFAAPQALAEGKKIATPSGELSVTESGDGEFSLNLANKSLNAPANRLEGRNVEIHSAYPLDGKENSIVLIAVYSGGAACPATFVLVDVSFSPAYVSREFGSCSDLPDITMKSGELRLSFPTQTDRERYVYKDGELTMVSSPRAPQGADASPAAPSPEASAPAVAALEFPNAVLEFHNMTEIQQKSFKLAVAGKGVKGSGAVVDIQECGFLKLSKAHSKCYEVEVENRGAKAVVYLPLSMRDTVAKYGKGSMINFSCEAINIIPYGFWSTVYCDIADD